MRIGLLSTGLFVVAFLATPASAQQNPRDISRLYNQQSGPIDREQRDWRDYHNYDYNRYEDGRRVYYANRYYRDGRYYDVRSLTRNDRIYRGGNHQYYCRRDDGTTGLIVHGIVGRLPSDFIPRGGSSLIGTLIDGGRASLGSAVDRGEVKCR